MFPEGAEKTILNALDIARLDSPECCFTCKFLDCWHYWSHTLNPSESEKYRIICLQRAWTHKYKVFLSWLCRDNENTLSPDLSQVIGHCRRFPPIREKVSVTPGDYCWLWQPRDISVERKINELWLFLHDIANSEAEALDDIRQIEAAGDDE